MKVTYFVLSNGHVIRATDVFAANPANVLYEDTGQVDAGGLYWIALDEFDTDHDRAMVCGPNGLWSTANLGAVGPAWALEVATPAGYECFRMVRSSPVQDGVWMAIAVDTANEVRVYWTDDDGLNWSSRDLSGDCGQTPIDCGVYLEMSSHDVNKAWVSFYKFNDGIFYVAYTDDMWTTASCTNLSCLRHQSYVYENGPAHHHRYTENDDDDIVIWGGVHYTDRESRILYCTDDVADCDDCVTICTGTDAGRRYAICECGCYKYASDSWWALAWCDTWIEWWVSDNGVDWTQNFFWSRNLSATARRIRHGCAFEESADWFCVVEDGDGGTYGPLWASRDRGDNFQRQTGNWNALCVAKGWTGGSEVDVFCIAPAGDVLNFDLTPAGGGFYPQAMDVDADGDRLYIGLYHVATGFPVLLGVDLALETDAIADTLFDPGAGDAINVDGINWGNQLAIAGRFSAGGNDSVQTSVNGGLNWSDIAPNWGDDAMPLSVAPNDLDEILACLQAAQDIVYTGDGGGTWTVINAAVGYSPAALAEHHQSNELVLGNGAGNRIDYSPNRGITLTNVTGAFGGNPCAIEVA